MSKRKGQLKYTQRGFQQDAEAAMKGDVVRALIELITNADDAYDGKGNGYIEINYAKLSYPYQGKFSVRDHASGLDGSSMEKAFTNLGDKNAKAVSEFGTRGLFGRGAKDIAALGRASFSSIVNGKFSSLEINHRGEYQMDFFDDKPTVEAFHITGLKTGFSGLTAELYVHEQHRVPSSAEMIEKLETNVQLRDLLNRNEVYYLDSRNNSKKRLIGMEPTGDLLLDVEVKVPKYGKSVHLTVYRLPMKEVGSIDSYSKHGIVVSGRGATYENTLLHLSNRPEAGWFCGRLDAPEIHDLSRDLDEDGGLTELNPTRVISRSRDGLVREHPYYRALCASIEPHLKPIMDAVSEEEGAKRTEGEKLRNRFNALSNTLANKLQELLDQSDSGEIPVDTEAEDSIQDFSIIPPRRILKQGETVTLTLRAPVNMDLANLDISLQQASRVLEIVDIPDPSKWKHHERLSMISNSIRIKGISVGNSKVSASCNGVSARSEVTVIDYELPPDEIPTQLIFDPAKVSVAPEKRKILLLRAPIEFSGEGVLISASEKLLEVQERVSLKPNASGTFCEARVVALAGPEEGHVVVTSSIGSVLARVAIHITESGHRRNPKLDFELSGRDNPPQRVTASIEGGCLMIRMYGKHRSLKNIFGNYAASGFENENTPEASATISEVLAQQLASYVVEREAELHPDRFRDAAMFFARQQQLVPHFVIALQAGLVNRY